MAKIIKDDSIKAFPIDSIWNKKKKHAIPKRLTQSFEFKEFEKWCEKNHKYPIKLLKIYCRMTVLKNEDLTYFKS